jgi:hypothetical protein
MSKLAPLTPLDHLTFGTCACGKHLKPHAVVCANCAKGMCIDCEDDAALCVSCGGTVCPDCQAHARRRAYYGSLYQRSGYEYLCNPCCAKQDAAMAPLYDALMECADAISREPGPWLLAIVDQLEAALEKAKESL